MSNLKDVIAGRAYGKGVQESDRAGFSIPAGVNRIVVRASRDAWDAMNGAGVLESTGTTDPFTKQDLKHGGNDLEAVRAYLWLSYDGGNTWFSGGMMGAGGGNHIFRNGSLALESTMAFWVPDPGNALRMARVTLEIRKACRTKVDVDLLTLPDPGFVYADDHHSVAINASSAGASGNALFTIGTGTITPGGTNRLLFISGVNAGSSGRTVDFLWNGAAITAEFWDIQAQSFFGAAAAYLLNPAASAAAGSMTITGNVGQDDIGAGALACDGVDQVTPVGTPVTANGASGASSVTVSSAVGDAVIDTGYVYDTGITANQSQTARYSQTNINAETAFACGSKVGAASVTMGYAAAANGVYILGAVNIKAAAGGGGGGGGPFPHFTRRAMLGGMQALG